MNFPKSGKTKTPTKSVVPSIDDVLVDDNGNPINDDGEELVDDSGAPITKAASSAPAGGPSQYEEGHGTTGGWDAPEPKSVMGFLANISASGMRAVTGLGHVIAHPIDTASAIGDVALGGLQKARSAVGQHGLNPNSKSVMEQEDPAYNKSGVFDAFVASLKERYGGMSAISNTLYEDPVGSAMDIAGLLSGGATATESRLPAISKFMRKASEAVDPIRNAGRAVRATGRGAAKLGEAYLGTSTGVGPEVIRTAEKGSAAFKAGMRGQVTHADAMDTVFESVGELANRRRANYQAQLAEIPKDFKLDPTPIREELQASLKRFNVRVVAGEKAPRLDFSRSSLRHVPQEVAKVQAAFDDLMTWGTRPDDLTPLGLDRLKQGLNEMVSASPGRGDVIVKAISDKTRSVLEAEVPGYKEMTSDYAQASRFLDEIKAELSANNSAKPGAGIRKLATALNQRADYRRNLIETLDISLGTDIKGTIAGLEMQQTMPRGIIGPMAVGAGGTALFQKLGAVTSNPQTLLAALAGAATFSPRLVGETLAAIANARRSSAIRGMGAAAGAAKRVVFDPQTFRMVQGSIKAHQKEKDRAGSYQKMHDYIIPPMPPPPVE